MLLFNLWIIILLFVDIVLWYWCFKLFRIDTYRIVPRGRQFRMACRRMIYQAMTSLIWTFPGLPQSWKNMGSWKVMENNENKKSWKSKNFILICIQNIVWWYFSKIVHQWILPEKFTIILTVEVVMQNSKCYPNLDSKYSHGYVGYRNFQNEFLVKNCENLAAEMVMENREFYPNLDSKYSHGYIGFQNCPEMNFLWKITRI